MVLLVCGEATGVREPGTDRPMDFISQEAAVHNTGPALKPDGFCSSAGCISTGGKKKRERKKNMTALDARNTGWHLRCLAF